MKTTELRKLIREEVRKVLNEATEQIPGKDDIIILVSDYAKKHIMEHNKPGVGSVFKSGITEDEIKEMVKKLAPKVSGDGGFYELNKPGIGYDLVLPIDKARALKDAKEGEVEKQEGTNKVKVPSISTSQPLSSFVSNRVSFLIKKSNPQFLPDDVKNDVTIEQKIKEGKCYSLITAFPGNPKIPKASEWNGKFSVIIPDTKLGESKKMKTTELRKLIREEVSKVLNEGSPNEMAGEEFLKTNHPSIKASKNAVENLYNAYLEFLDDSGKWDPGDTDDENGFMIVLDAIRPY